MNPNYVVLHIGLGPHKHDTSAPPVSSIMEKFFLREDMWIQRLDTESATNIQRACEPRYHNVDNDVRDRHLYAFIRSVKSPEPKKLAGVEDLITAIALSRVVHPTSTGDRYCAEIHDSQVKDSAISPVQFVGGSPDIFLGDTTRDWLTLDDAQKLKDLMPWVSPRKAMHSRVNRAYWNHEYALRSYYLDLRWVLVVSGLEALISVGETDLGRQFKQRSVQLAQEMGIALGPDDVHHAWKLRSKVVHAAGFLESFENQLDRSGQRQLYQKIESLLRATIYRCLSDPGFGGFFKDDQSVSARWPLTSPRKAGSASATKRKGTGP